MPFDRKYLPSNQLSRKIWVWFASKLHNIEWKYTIDLLITTVHLNYNVPIRRVVCYLTQNHTISIQFSKLLWNMQMEEPFINLWAGVRSKQTDRGRTSRLKSKHGKSMKGIHKPFLSPFFLMFRERQTHRINAKKIQQMPSACPWTPAWFLLDLGFLGLKSGIYISWSTIYST